MATGSGDREARLRASRELGKANRAIGAIRSFYVANAMLAGLVLGLMLLAEAGGLYIGISAAVFLVALAGIRGVRSEPFLWTLGAAVVWTLLVALMLAAGAAGGVYFFLSCAWALGCWLILITTHGVRDLIRKNPDLWIARRMRDRGTGA
jgi:hypothetical protein